MGASSPMCDLLVVAVISSVLCAIHGERVAEISSLRVFALCPQRSIFLAGSSEQPRPPTRPTRMHCSARSIFRGHPPHYRPKLNCPLQATLAMQGRGGVRGGGWVPPAPLPTPHPYWSRSNGGQFCASPEIHLPRATECHTVLHNGGSKPFLKICKGKKTAALVMQWHLPEGM